MEPMTTKENKQTPITPPRFYSMNEFSKLTGVSKFRLYKLIDERRITPIVNLAKGYRFKGDEINERVLEYL